MYHRVSIYLALIAALIFLYCSNDNDDDQINSIQEAEEQISQAGEKLAESMKEMTDAMQGKAGKEPVHYTKLKNLLPERVNAFTRTSAEGKTTNTMGMKISEVEAAYKSDSDSRLDIHITDMGNMSGLTAMASAAWAFSDFESDTDEGYEKTTRINGNKAMEKYNKIQRNGKLSILIAERFVFEIEGNDVEMDQLKGFVDKINLDVLKDIGEK